MNLQRGFLISYIKYGENDAVLHCFTEEEGFQAYFLKGIYTKRNKKKALLLPLNKLILFLSPIKKNGIDTILKIEQEKNNDIYTDTKINNIIFFIADFLNHILKNENKSPILCLEIEEFINELSVKNYQCHFIFLIKILKIQGISPLVNDESYLDPETGIFSSNMNHQLFDSAISLIWKSILLSDNPYEIKIHSSFRKPFLDSILVYYHYHYTDFKTPISLEVIQEIFD